MKTTALICIAALLSIFLFSCKENKKENLIITNKPLQEYTGALIKKVNKNGKITLIAPMNNLKIDCTKKNAETAYIVTHKNCVNNNVFELESKAITSNIDNTETFTLDSFKTNIKRENTPYYLVENGIKVKETFKDNDTFLIIEVLLTKTKNEIKEVELKNKNLIKKPLKADDVLDFHLVDNDTGKEIGDTECPPYFINKGDDRNYNYCATLISCK